MEIYKAIEMAINMGFDVAEEIDPSKLKFMPEVRDMCKQCRGYGKKWSCPPACGSLDEVTARCKSYSRGILVQTVCRYDTDDIEEMFLSEPLHGNNFLKLAKAFEALNIDMLAMGTGGCRRCDTCSYPDEPCRNPDLVFPSMEACGLLVSDVCKDNGIPYYYGPDTVAYNSCFLFP